VNPTGVMTAMGKKLWPDRVASEPMMRRTPQGKFAGKSKSYLP